MKRIRCTRFLAAVSLFVWLAVTPGVWAVNYVVDGLNGDDLNGGVSATGGASDLAGLDFSDAFQTIGQATSVAVDGDAIFVNAGRYVEQVSLTISASLYAVGEVVIGPGLPIGIDVGFVSDVTINGFTVVDCRFGITVSDRLTSIRLTNLTVRNCDVGLNLFFGNITVRRCIATGCVNGVTISGAVVDIERTSLVGNRGGAVFQPGIREGSFRNNIVAFNSQLGIRSPLGPLIDFNNVFSNVLDYEGVAGPGPNDISVDPQFIDLARRILTLKPTSPMVNAGEGLGGGPPMTIGARECGFASSNALDGWADWIDEDGVLVTSGLSTLVEIDAGTGQIILKPSVSRASVRSRVFSKGPLKTLQFAALEDLAQPSGSRSLIDRLDTTFQRELRFRASDTAFAATDAAPAFETVFEHQELFLATNRRFVQVELTLTNGGL